MGRAKEIYSNEFFFSNYGTVFDFMLKPKILGGMFWNENATRS